eukprot:3094045-Rhodomonas_salina.4
MQRPGRPAKFKFSHGDRDTGSRGQCRNCVQVKLAWDPDVMIQCCCSGPRHGSADEGDGMMVAKGGRLRERLHRATQPAACQH